MGSNFTILRKGDVVDEKYTVQFFIKKGSHAETYRVKNAQGRPLFLKVFNYEALHPTQLDGDGRIKEIEFLKTIRHKNIVRYVDSGEFVKGGVYYAFLVLGYISGETLEERLKREVRLKAVDVYKIVIALLDALRYLHSMERPVIHNDINHQNVMVDLRDGGLVPKLIDFGYARYFYNSTRVYYRKGLNPFYLAPECFHDEFSPQSDLYAVGVLIYHLLFGELPWDVGHLGRDVSDFELARRICAARQEPVKVRAFSCEDKDDLFNLLVSICLKALHSNLDRRFKSAEEMLWALEGVIPMDFPDGSAMFSEKGGPFVPPTGGFSEIAGMEELKEILYHDVIRALNEKELYERYGLTIPNGMLLYGPPGCGKSFIAQKLAEEAGHTYLEVNPSDLASIYVHGTQERIAELFKWARDNAPAIINFEEFDALVPRRDRQQSHYQSGEVNEFLTQLNNCGKTGVFVIATTNQPHLIDPAVLRAGRIDKIVYVPPPDYKARMEMFKLLLKNRPVGSEINFEELAKRTEYFVSSDIELIVNESARKALRLNSIITQEILLEAISFAKPSVNKDELTKYEQLRIEMERVNAINSGRRPIGFRID